MTRKRRNITYKDWITEEGLIKLEGMARDGLVNEDIAKQIGIHPSTLYDWQKKYPDISEALKKGKEVIDRQVENALLKRALGYEYEEVKQIVEMGADGKDRKKIEKTIKHVAPDTTAQIYWLNNRKPDQWRNRKWVEQKIEATQTIENKYDDEVKAVLDMNSKAVDDLYKEMFDKLNKDNDDKNKGKGK